LLKLQVAEVYTPINIEEVRAAAKSQLKNARAAGRLTAEETKKMQESLVDANSLKQSKALGQRWKLALKKLSRTTSASIT
jgi:hypothetical protein